ncbi:MAG TPA: hypothetical protein PKO06_12685 [Candidatus Ozemobacteraceae bacterium]|nr:hypothetical protein [Candidatus Ozemobacteraceae bacterium]
MGLQPKVLLLICIICCLPAIQNCGSSGGGGTSDVIIADQLINDGWANIQVGQYKTAVTNFQQALAQSMTDAQSVSANSGYGWALAKDGRINEAIPFFEVASGKGDHEATVGLAGALIFRHQTSEDYLRSAELLDKLIKANNEAISIPHAGLGLNKAKIYALAAISFALANDLPNAKYYINKAAALDSTMVGTTVDRIDEAFTLLGWRD